MTIKWDESTTKKYKEPTQTIPQEVDILYTPISLNTGGNAKMFLGSIDDDSTIDSKYIFLIYTTPNNPNLFSGYVFIYDLDGNLENLSKYEEGIKIAVASNSRMASRDGGGFTMGELLDFIGGDWFGLTGFIENDLVNVYWPEFTDVEDTGGGYTDWFNPNISIPATGNGGGSSGGNGGSNTNDPDMDIIVWWQPITIFAHGISISNAIEVDLSSIEANWLMNTATQEQLDAIANYINNLEQTERYGYNQGDIDFVVAAIMALVNGEIDNFENYFNPTNVPPDCESFDYHKIGGTNWQCAAVIGIHELFTIVNWDCIGVEMGIFHQALYFQLPINSQFLLNSGSTATDSAILLQLGFENFDNWYNENGCNTTPTNMSQILLDFIKDEFEYVGGNVTLTPPDGFNEAPTLYKYRWFGYGNCN